MKLMTVFILFNLASALTFAGVYSSSTHQPVVSSAHAGGPGSAARESATLGVRPGACRIRATPAGGCPPRECGNELAGLHVLDYLAPVGSSGDELDIDHGELIIVRDNARVRRGRLLVGGKLIFGNESGRRRELAIDDYQRVLPSDAADGQVHHRYLLVDEELDRWFEFTCQRP